MTTDQARKNPGLSVPLTPEELRSARQLAGLTQVQLARRVGIKQSTLSLYESGFAEVSADLRSRFEEVFNRHFAQAGRKGRSGRGKMNRLAIANLKSKPMADLTPGDWATLLNNARVEAHLSQHEVAKKLGISRTRLSQWETGKLIPTPDERSRCWDAITTLQTVKTKADPLRLFELEHEHSQKLQSEKEGLQRENQRLLDAIRAKDEALRQYAQLLAIDEELSLKRGELIDELEAVLGEISGEKNAKIAALEQQVTDLRALYDAGTQAALAHEKFEELREKVSAPWKGR
jgi:transcriptional regulator with XRE-family HTH domain